MLRGADFIIGVVSARRNDPTQTIFHDRHTSKNYEPLALLYHGHTVTVLWH